MERFILLFSLSIYLSFVSSATIDHNSKQDILTDDKHYQTGDHNKNYDHEAFVGEDEAKKYDQLTPEQSRERLAKLIPVIDKDADSFLEEEELNSHIKFMQKRYVLKDVDRTWKNYDATKFVNGDKLPWPVYQEAVYGTEDDSMTEEYKAMLQKDRRRWKAADKLNDDSLDKEEYTCFMHPETCDHMKDIIVLETVEDIDKDKDGHVDMEEYIRDMYRPEDYPDQKSEPEWVKSERDMFLLYRDKDKDGKLDKEEMREWITPSGFDHAEAEAKHLINLADDNKREALCCPEAYAVSNIVPSRRGGSCRKDGKLSMEEILSHYDVFVGSQATDYGEQLQQHDPSEL